MGKGSIIIDYVRIAVAEAMPPVADAKATLDHRGKLVLDGTDSVDADGIIASHLWELINQDPQGEDYFLEGQIAPTDAVDTGIYTVKLTVTDDDGLMDTDTLNAFIVPVSCPPGSGGSGPVAWGVFADEVMLYSDPGGQGPGEGPPASMLGLPDGHKVDLDGGGTTLRFTDDAVEFDWDVNIPDAAQLIIVDTGAIDLPEDVHWGYGIPIDNGDGVATNRIGRAQFLSVETIQAPPWDPTGQTANLLFYSLGADFTGDFTDLFLSINADTDPVDPGDQEIDSTMFIEALFMVLQGQVARAKGPVIVEATSPEGAEITLDGTDSYSSDEDLIYSWSAPGITFNGASDVTPTPTATFPMGETVVTLRVNGGIGVLRNDTINVIVQDTTAPEVELLSPHGGEIVKAGPGASFTIQWAPATDVASESVLLSLDYRIGDGAWQVIDTAVPNSGAFGWSPIPAADQANVYVRILADDGNGNIGEDICAAPFTIDSISSDTPIITTPIPSAVLNEDALTITGFVATGPTVDIYHVDIYDGLPEPDGSNRLASAVTEDGHFAVVAELVEGNYALRAVATDTAGNSSAVSEEITFTVDRTPPAAPTFISPESGVTNVREVTLIGSAPEATSVTLWDNGTILGDVNIADGVFSFVTRALVDGEHIFTAQAVDEAGNTSESTSEAVTVTVDTAAPVIESQMLLDSAGEIQQEFRTNETVQVSYTVSDASATVVLSATSSSGEPITIDATTNQIAFPLPVGTLTVNLTATDTAGNSAEASVSAIVKALVARLDVTPNVFVIEIPEKGKKPKKNEDIFKKPILLTCYLSIEGADPTELGDTSLLFNDRLTPMTTVVRDSVLEAQFEIDIDFITSLLSLDPTLIEKVELKDESVKVTLYKPVEMASITLGQLQVTGALDGADFVSEDASRHVTLKELAAPAVGQNFLAQNFPNPFNPETWIPYALLSDADVTIHIFSPQGQLMRRLDLGRQEAGFYVERDEAAYWDGRNRVGERVASGLYFYTLQAGDFTATRRMLIVK